MSGDDKTAIWKDFRAAVNMSPARSSKWLESEDSKRVGWKYNDGKGSGERVGHHSRRRIIEIKRKKNIDLMADDYAYMKTVVGYVARHQAQRPARDVSHSDWRHSLMN